MFCHGPVRHWRHNLPGTCGRRNHLRDKPGSAARPLYDRAMAGSEGIEPSRRTSKDRDLPLIELPVNGWTGENRTLGERFTASRSATDLRPTYTGAHARS